MRILSHNLTCSPVHTSLTRFAASGFKVDITRQLMSCLRPGQWLTDEVLNYYISLLNARNVELRAAQQPGARSVPDAHFHNTFFMTKLNDDERGYCYNNVKKWTMRKRKVSVILFTADILCESCSHCQC